MYSTLSKAIYRVKLCGEIGMIRIGQRALLLRLIGLIEINGIAHYTNRFMKFNLCPSLFYQIMYQFN